LGYSASLYFPTVPHPARLKTNKAPRLIETALPFNVRKIPVNGNI